MGKQCVKYIPAKMNKRVTIEYVTQTSDGQGGYTEEWKELAKAWCAIEPIKAFEKFQAMQQQAPITHKIMMRYRTMSPEYRINYDDRIFYLREIVNINEDNMWLRITAVEKA